MKKLATSDNCFVCGRLNQHGLHMHFYQPAPGEVQAKITVPDHFQGYPGVVHGGVVAAMLDEVSGRAIPMEAGGESTRFLVTASLEIRYRRPVPTGQPVELKGHLLSDNGRVAKVRGEIFGQNGVLLAEADGVMVNMPDALLEESRQAQLGWRVEPEEGQQ